MKRLGSALIAFCLVSCGSPSSKKSGEPRAAGSSALDLSTESSLQFYAASGIGVSAIRYVLRPSAGKLQKYSPGNGSNLEVEKSVDLSAAQLSALIAPLSKMSKTSWGVCTSTCKSNERTVWVEKPDATYYYGTESNCYCAGVSDKPSLTYSEIEAVYQAILAYFP
jgi:hypothetical protein